MQRSLFTLVILTTLLAGCASSTSAPPAPSASGSSRMKSVDQKAILAYHNKVRADVGVGPLRWDDGLATYAQQWADHLATTTCRMKHRQPNIYGENLFQGTAGHYTAVDAAKGWESEKQIYRGDVITEKNYAPIGHYTQMVWRTTTQVGCGEALCDGTLLVACNYDPPGNYLGQKPY